MLISAGELTNEQQWPITHRRKSGKEGDVLCEMPGKAIQPGEHCFGYWRYLFICPDSPSISPPVDILPILAQRTPREQAEAQEQTLFFRRVRLNNLRAFSNDIGSVRIL